jgi:hypothetical protein
MCLLHQTTIWIALAPGVRSPSSSGAVCRAARCYCDTCGELHRPGNVCNTGLIVCSGVGSNAHCTQCGQETVHGVSHKLQAGYALPWSTCGLVVAPGLPQTHHAFTTLLVHGWFDALLCFFLHGYMCEVACAGSYNNCAGLVGGVYTA